MAERFPNGLPAEVLKDLNELGPRPFARKYKVSVGTYYTWRKKYGLSASSKTSRRSAKKRAASEIIVEIEVGGTTMSIPLSSEGIKIRLGRK